jgi:hypothetical protein
MFYHSPSNMQHSYHCDICLFHGKLAIRAADEGHFAWAASYILQPQAMHNTVEDGCAYDI